MTEKLIAHARARFDHAQQKKILAEKYEAKMLFANAGGLWKAGPSLLTTLSVCQDSTAVILDEYNNPVEVNVSELKYLAYQRWQEMLNLWKAELEEMSKQR